MSMIDYIEFQVSDIARAKAFYQELFNWQYLDYGEEYCEFRDKKLKGGFAKVKENPNHGVAPGLISPLIIFHSGELDVMYAKVKQSDAEIIKEIFAFPGGKRFEFLDPFGHRLAIWTEENR